MEAHHVIKNWCVDLIDNHYPLLGMTVDLGGDLVRDALIPLHTTRIGAGNESSILLPISLHQSLILEYDIDLMLRELQE